MDIKHPNDFEEGSLSSQDSTTDDPHQPTEEDGRDEVGEVKKMSAEDTSRIRMWRFVVTACLVAMAVAITKTTHSFLRDEQQTNFDVAFEQFSRTVGDAAIEHQRLIRESLQSISDRMTTYATSANKTWPFVTAPFFEVDAANLQSQAGIEIVVYFPKVEEKDREAWIEYSDTHYKEMVEEAHMLQKGSLERLKEVGYKPYVSKITAAGFAEQDIKESYFPTWQFSPPMATYSLLNWDVVSIPDYGNAIAGVQELKNETLVTPVRPYQVGVPHAFSQEEHDAMHSKLPDSHAEHPHSFFCYPVHKTVHDTNSPIVGVVATAVAWDRSMKSLLPEGVEGLTAVVKNSCDQAYTYSIDGPVARFLGADDLHETRFDAKEVVVDLALHTHPQFDETPGHCRYSMHIYPSSVFEASYDSNTPEIFAAVIAISFAVVIVVFFVYDMFVQRRNEKLVANAARSNAIVSSLFPGAIRDRLIKQDSADEALVSKKKGSLKNFLSKGGELDKGSKPLAELFLETTVIFADIVGFTAWSSVREPTQVFTLLETVYAAFDELARRRRVYKVETVGDCYVAVCGLPDPRTDHAVVMARFARGIMNKMQLVVRDLEVQLGPDTGDLSLRVGMHSGPVTAGVLRGERARFQLFGDTVNTCARIEGAGLSGKIHISKETADILATAGKGSWVVPRKGQIQAKGKGEIQTYWLLRSSCREDGAAATQSDGGSSVLMDADLLGLEENVEDDRTSRLIDWNVEKLVEILKQVIASRGFIQPRNERRNSSDNKHKDIPCAATPLEEVKEIITLPEFDNQKSCKKINPEDVVVPDIVLHQIRDYVNCVASMYRDNPFHNFAHCSHVVMSVTKLMSRIVAPKHLEDVDDENAATLHDHTYGITSDPLTQFACAFSALIHDVDHTGVGNPQLAKENETLATLYKNRSIAEQNSLDLAWALLLDSRYNEFRAALCATTEELQHFRELVVNSVMATDIMDKELKELRNARWDKAFKGTTKENTRDAVNRKATIVIEHIIQASDVSHTMQHWHVYRKWNENLFREMYKAYKEGRSETDPSTNWYRGEIGFFDFYIIPLAKKLKDCGVFGVSSDEYLNYAIQNRNEWEARGQAVIAEMMESVKNSF